MTPAAQLHHEVAVLTTTLASGPTRARRTDLEALADRLDELARDSDEVTSWHLALARDILESHLLAIWHLEEAGVSADRCESVLERAIRGAGDHLREVLAERAS